MKLSEAAAIGIEKTGFYGGSIFGKNHKGEDCTCYLGAVAEGAGIDIRNRPDNVIYEDLEERFPELTQARSVDSLPADLRIRAGSNSTLTDQLWRINDGAALRPLRLRGTPFDVADPRPAINAWVQSLGL